MKERRKEEKERSKDHQTELCCCENEIKSHIESTIPFPQHD